MKRHLYYFFLFCTLVLSLSCSDNHDNSLFDDVKAKAAGLYLKIETKEKEKEYLLDIYYGHNYFNDNGILSAGIQDRYFGINIYFVSEGESINYDLIINNDEEKLIDSYKLDNFATIDYDCLYNGSINYRNCYCYRLNRLMFDRNGIIVVCLFNKSINSGGIITHVERLSYSIENGLGSYKG